MATATVRLGRKLTRDRTRQKARSGGRSKGSPEKTLPGEAFEPRTPFERYLWALRRLGAASEVYAFASRASEAYGSSEDYEGSAAHGAGIIWSEARDEATQLARESNCHLSGTALRGDSPKEAKHKALQAIEDAERAEAAKLQAEAVFAILRDEFEAVASSVYQAGELTRDKASETRIQNAARLAVQQAGEAGQATVARAIFKEEIRGDVARQALSDLARVVALEEITKAIAAANAPEGDTPDAYAYRTPEAGTQKTKLEADAVSEQEKAFVAVAAERERADEKARFENPRRHLDAGHDIVDGARGTYCIDCRCYIAPPAP